MLKCVENFLNEFNIKNKTVILAFSSGPDSVTLALLLNQLKEKFNLEIVLAYFNHGWRKEAKNEEDFTQDFAKKNKCRFEIGIAPENSKKTESAARELRYEFLKNCALKYETDVVFLAHNKNDNIETLIYRVIKGTSVKGLTSIPKQRDIYYRPLLEISKTDILNYLKQNNQGFMIDSSNNDIKYSRNLIRNEILPLFLKINPNYLSNIDLLIKNAIATKKILDSKISSIEESIILDNKILRNEFVKLEQEYQLEILNNYLEPFLKTKDSKTLFRFQKFIVKETDSKISINKNTFLKIKNDFISVEKKSLSLKNNAFVEIRGIGRYNFENICLTVEKCSKLPEKFPFSKDNICYLNLDFSTPYVLRHRNFGDVFCPFGLKKGIMKLKDYLINEKVEQTKKDELIMLAKTKEITWVLGMKISENNRVKSSDNCYKLSWELINSEQ